MSEQVLDRAIEVLEADPELYVPVKKLHRTLQNEGVSSLALEDLYGLLIADPRFELIEGTDTGLVDSEFAAMMEQEMESLGFFSGPRVKLAIREMSTDEVLDGLTRSLQQLNQALKGAWESRPEDDPETEAMLRDALSMAEQLEQDVRELTDSQEEAPDTGEIS